MVLLVAINNAEQYPTKDPANMKTALAIVTACTTYLRDNEIVPGPGLFAFAHGLGLLDHCYRPFGDMEPA